MSAKRPQTDHGRARHAFVTGKISRGEYLDCLADRALISRNALWLERETAYGIYRLIFLRHLRKPRHWRGIP